MLALENIILAAIGLGALGFLVRRITRPTSKGCGKRCGCAKDAPPKER